MTRVKVPYNLAKFHTVKFLKNFNVKISMKFSGQENFMKFSITRYKGYADIHGGLLDGASHESGNCRFYARQQ